MERLTKRLETEHGYGYINCTTKCPDVSEPCEKCEHFHKMVERLAEYEDTNLTPSQIQVAFNYSGWIDDGYGSYVKVCAHCGGKPLMLHDNLYYSKYCPHCGSIMITGVTYGN